MCNNKFIVVSVMEKDNKILPTYVNINHIQKIWETNNEIIIELTDYTSLRICHENINVFMDRFI